MKKSITAVALVAVASGCAFGDSGADGWGEVEVGLAKQAVTVTSGRTVPYPIKRDLVGGSIVTDIDPTTNKPRLQWDASYMEMLVADELGKCVAEVAGTTTTAVIGDVGKYMFAGVGLPAMDSITSAISKGYCPRTEYRPNPTSFPSATVEWALRRSDPNCNADNTTGEAIAAIELPQRDPESLVSDYLNQHDPNSSSYPGSPLRGFTCAPATSPVCPVRPAFGWIFQAEVGLCLAQRLNGLLEGAELFTATTQEHMLVLGLGHEIAQHAMMKLGYLLKLQQKQNSDIPPNNFSGNATGAYLRLWMDGSPSAVAKVRQSFLQALRLTGAAATTLASYLQRQAGARWTTASNAGAFSRDWGIDSARNRLLNLVYGGGTLDNLWGIDEAVYGGHTAQWFSEVKEATADPRVAVMFSLARQGDALYFHPLGSGSSVTLDSASWEAMYLEAELGQRVRDCSNSNPALCTKDALRSELPATSNANEFTLNRVFGLNLGHAKTLSTMLFDAAVRHEFVDGVRPSYGMFHLSGHHSATAPANHASESGWIKVDKDTVLFPYGFEERAQSGYSVSSAADVGWDDVAMSSVFDDVAGYQEESHGLLGVVSALGFAREVLFEQGGVISDAELSQSVTDALKEVERLAGKWTAMRRASSIDLIMPAPAAQTAPTLVNPAQSGVSPGLKTSARNKSFVGPNGIGRTTLDSAARVDGTIQPGSGLASGLARLTWKPTSGTSWPRASSLLLRKASGDYIFLSETRAADQDSEFEPFVTVTEDGWFAALVAQVVTVSSANWSTPRYDGFGLSKRWVPPADASLMGGTAGEESYQYLLRSAKAAAEDATAAVKTAIDKLSEEARDATALKGAETRAQAIGAMEQRALCGVGTCDLKYLPVNFDFADTGAVCSSAPASSASRCLDTLKIYSALLDERSLPEAVAKALASQATEFASSDGSERERIMIRIWNAARLILGARDQAGQLAVAAAAEQAAADSAVLAADAALALADAALNQLKSDYNDKVNSIRARIAQANWEVGNAKWRVNTFCDFVVDGTNWLVDVLPESGYDQAYGVPFGDGDTIAAGFQRCSDALSQLGSAIAERDALVGSTNEEIRDLAPGRIDSVTLASIASQWDAAIAQHDAALTQQAARMKENGVQTGAHLAVLGQTIGERELALAELKQLTLKVSQSQARAALESSLAADATANNAELRRKYRSYDLWRARALLESARRLANAARRSIEARFVVDLSTLDAEQAFVASPSTWADEIYESDLNAPEVVGLSQMPKVEGAIYPNKLIDYVGNLERFVQGYTISYPTSISMPDTEVITLGGPDQVKMVGDAAQAVLSPDTAGWMFYCASQKTWIGHPGIDDHGIVQRLDNACSGKPPALAKFGFWLDPWGVMNGAWTRPQFVDRHNVRWRRLAVNLVGTGIRDCSKSTDSMSCYTNPYVRFNLVHAGASWQTNYAGEWRALDIPTAHIEAGKALAAEEWLEPISNSWNMPYVSNVARGELFGRPAAGNYELVLEVTPDVQLDRIERVQLLVEQDYWVKQTGGRGVYGDPTPTLPSGAGGFTGAGGATGTGGSTSSGGTTGSGGSSNSGGSAGTAGTTGTSLTGSCTPVGSDPRIEDFEDHNKVVGSFEQRLGVWYGFHAGTCTVSPPTNDSFVPLAPSPSNGSAYAGYTSGSGCNAGDWQGGGIGFTFLSGYANNVETACSNYDATKYGGITFQAQGSGEIRVEVCTTDVGTGDGVNCHGAYFTISGTWTQYSVLWGALTQRPGWGTTATFNKAHLRKLQFLSLSQNYSFAVDNIAFTN